MPWAVHKDVTPKTSNIRFYLLSGMLAGMCWLFLAPSPLPFGIAIQRELGFVGHASVFTVFTLTCSIAFPKALRPVAIGILGAAVCLEAAQMLIPSRGADIMDFAMNCFGIGTGFVIYRIGAALVTYSGLSISKA